MSGSNTDGSPPVRRRRLVLMLPTDPSEEELVRDWTLSEADLKEVCRCCGDGHRLRFAIQLCVLRRYGQFVSDFAAVPVRIANHLCRQLNLAPVLFVEPPAREATDLDQEHRIREYLGFQHFTPAVRQRLEQELTKQASEGRLPPELLGHADVLLSSWKVILPAPTTLERLVSSVVAHAQEEIFQQISDKLPAAFCTKSDELLFVTTKARYSPLFRLKEYPPEPTPTAIISYIERVRLVQALGTSELDFTGLSPAHVGSLAQLARHYDATTSSASPRPNVMPLLRAFWLKPRRCCLIISWQCTTTSSRG